MNILIFILSFTIFLFTLYRLVKDDHVFLRKNIKHEQVFDVIFLAVISGLIFAQFTFVKSNLPVPQIVLGGGIAAFLIGKYKKFPIRRFFDFFAISFLNSLTVVFLTDGLFSRKIEMSLFLFEAFIYLLLSVFFTKSFLSKIMSRTSKEGRLSIYVFIIYSLFSILIAVFNMIRKHISFWNPETISLIVILIISIILLLKQNTERVK